MTSAIPVLTERRGDIAVVRLNRPQARNALDTASLQLLTSTLAELAADPELRVLVLSSTDTTALCAGADIAEALDAAGGEARMQLFTELYAAIEAFPVPTIAVGVGNCVGAGAELIAGVDVRVIGDNLKLAWAGSRLGVPVGPARLSQLIGVARAKDLVFTGRVVGADEADALGLAQRRAPAAQAEAAALELAEALTRQHPGGLRVIKAMFRELDGSSARVAHENELLLRFQRDGAGLPRG